jgi:two-component system response regulator RstA
MSMSISGGPPHSPSTILIVEDDTKLAELIADYLRKHGYGAQIEVRGDRAVERIRRSPPDLLILDLMLPGADGLTICRRIRPEYAGPILMLTARGEDSDEVNGLELGADDYLAKPAVPRVLLARVRALLRRGRTPQTPPPPSVQVADLIIDRATRTALLCGSPLQLTSGEFDLLWLFALHAGKELARPFLYEQLYSADWDDIDRSIDLRVSRLRQKLARHCGEEVIKTVRGVGYLYVRS